MATQRRTVTTTAATSLAPPAGGSGADAGGWDTAANRNAAIVTITAIRTDLANLITALQTRNVLR